MKSKTFRIVVNFLILCLVGLGVTSVLEMTGTSMSVMNKLVLSAVFAIVMSIFYANDKKRNTVIVH